MPAATAAAAKKPSPKRAVNQALTRIDPGDHLTLSHSVSLQLSKGGEGERRKFEAVAYSGGEFRQESMMGTRRGVIDLSGLDHDLGERGKPLMLNHGLGDFAAGESAIGVITGAKVVAGRGLVLSGHMLTNPTAQQVIQNADDGYPYEFSVGIDVFEVDEVGENLSLSVNGQDFAGPGEHIKRSRLREGSIVANGADSQTSTVILTKRNNKMSTEPEQAALADDTEGQGADLAGFVATLSDDDKAQLREMLADGPPMAEDEEDDSEDMTATPEPAASLSERVEQLRKLKGADGEFVVAALQADLSLSAAKIMLADRQRLAEQQAPKGGRPPLKLGAGSTAPAAKFDGSDPEKEWEASKELREFYGNKKGAFLRNLEACKSGGSLPSERLAEVYPETLRATA